MADNKEVTEKILNKKFKKVVFSGYDTDDVDSFFDEIIAYLTECTNLLSGHEAASKELKDKNEKLQKQVKELTDKVKKLEAEVLEYEEEGYGKLFNNRKTPKQGE